MIDRQTLEKVSNQIINGSPKILTTGFQKLDDCVLCGVENGSLITIGARPAMGKTALALCILYNILKQGKKCMFFSFEFNTLLFLKRFIGIVGDIDCHHLSSNEYLNEKDITSIKKAVDEISSFDLMLYDDGVYINSIKERIETEKPEFVFIDYIQLVELSGEKERYEEIAIFILELKKIAKENNCIIFILSQLTRSPEKRANKLPMLWDLRESGSLEAISDVVIMIYRNDYYRSYDDDDDADYAIKKGCADIMVVKNRFGACEDVHLLFKPDSGKFLEPINYDEF